MNTKNGKCICGKLPKDPLVSVPGCADDFVAISSLPNDWVPRHSGQTLKNFLKKNEYEYHTTLKHFKEKAEFINNDINNRVHMISECLLSEVRQNQRDMVCVARNYSPSDNKNEALQQIYTLSSRRIEDLAKFKQEAFRLEKQRADGLRDAIKFYFQRLMAIGYKSPKDLLHDFDESIFEINQQLLSNRRAFIELEMQLRMQLNENEIHAISILNQLCFKVQSEPSQDIETVSPIEQDTNDEKINKITSQLIDAYNDVIDILLNTYLNLLENLFKNIKEKKRFYNENSFFNNEDDVKQTFQSFTDIYNQLLNFITKNIGYNMPSFLTNIQPSLTSLKNCLQDIFAMLFDINNIWQNHVKRFSLGRTLVLAGLEDLQGFHDATELANEININIALENLCKASDIDKLKYQFDYTNTLVKKVPELLFQHRKLELNKVEEFVDMTSIMVNLLLSECYYCLDKYPKTVTNSEHLESHESTSNIPEASSNHESTSNIPEASSNHESTSQIDVILTIMKPLQEIVSKAQEQEQRLNKWKNIFLESLGNKLDEIADRITDDSQKFVSKINSKVNIRYSLKYISYNVREERLKAAYETRLAELQSHDVQLTTHLDTIYNLVNDLLLEASNFLALDSPGLYPFCYWIDSIQSNIDSLLNQETVDPEIKRLKMMSYSQRLSRHRNLFEESLNPAIENYKKVIEEKIQEARISNVKFILKIKLFNEGGQYAAPEGLKACALLVKAADTLDSCEHRAIDALYHRRNQLLALADQKISAQRVEDVHNYGAKNGGDKKKQRNKKK